MKFVTFASFKGGAGKTTALMACASALLTRGKKVALFEADNNDPLRTWRDNAREIGTWDEAVGIFDAYDEKTLETSYEEATDQGFEYALLDSRGGDSELNTTAILNANMVLIPTSLTPIDIEFVIRTLRFAVQAMKQADVTVPVACLLTQVPNVSKQKASEKQSIEILSKLPTMTAQLAERGAFADLFANGLLHLHHTALLGNPAKKIAASHTDVALREAQALADEIMEAVAEERAA